MKDTPNTLNEEIKRMKSLFTEERLYGNLVEQEEEIKVMNLKNDKTKSFSKEDIIDKVEKGKWSDENVSIFVGNTLTKVSEVDWLADALKKQTDDDFEDSFGKKKSLKKKKDKTEGGGDEKVKLKDKLAANKKERKKKNTCKDGIKIRLNKWIKSSKDGTEVSDKVIEEFKSNPKDLAKLKSCGEKYKDDKEFLKLEGIGQFFSKLGLEGIFPEGEELEQAIDKQKIIGGGGVKFTIKTKEGDTIAKVVPGDVPTEYKVKGNNAMVLSDKKTLMDWVNDTMGWPDDIDIDDIKIKDNSVSNDFKEFVILKN